MQEKTTPAKGVVSIIVAKPKQVSLLHCMVRHLFGFAAFGTPGWIRTSGLQSRSLSRYPTALRALILCCLSDNEGYYTTLFLKLQALIFIFLILVVSLQFSCAKHRRI